MRQTIPPLVWTRLGVGDAWVFHESTGHSWVDVHDGRVKFGPTVQRASGERGGWWYSMGDPTARRSAGETVTDVEWDTTVVSTDCRTEVGVTVGLVDAVITLCRVLVTRDWSDPAVVAALSDLRADGDVYRVTSEEQGGREGDDG